MKSALSSTGLLRIVVPVLAVVLGVGSRLQASEGVITHTAVNLRQTPDSSGPVLMQLPYGTPCEFVAVQEKWARIRLPTPEHLEGYVSTRLVTSPPLKASPRDRGLIDELRKKLRAPDSIADIKRHEVDFVQDRMNAGVGISEVRWELRESLERWLFWDAQAPVKYRLWFLELIERDGIYQRTALELLRTSAAFHIPMSSYPNARIEHAPRPLRLPREAASFFDSLETPRGETGKNQDDSLSKLPLLYVVEARLESAQRINVPRGSVALQWLLSLYFADQPIELERNEDAFTLSSSRLVDFVLLAGGRAIPSKGKGRISYSPRDSELRLLVTSTPVSEASAERSLYLFFGEPGVLGQIAAKEVITVAQASRRFGGDLARSLGDVRARTLEYDFNHDGVLDLIQSHEACPEDAGDTDDRVDYFNIQGRWVAQLRWRTWCIP